MNKVMEAALAHFRKGRAVIPIPYRSKTPDRPGWQNERLDEATIQEQFGAANCNLGVLLGEPSNGLVRVDLDTPEAREIAPHVLPQTNMVMGRGKQWRSGYFYVVTAPIASESLKETNHRKDPQNPESRGVVVEILSKGRQTLIPPSVHPCGDSYSWDEEGEPGVISPVDLRRAVGVLHALALLAKRWTPGSRHDLALAYCGWRMKEGATDQELETQLTAICKAAGDSDVSERLQNIRTTRQRLQRGEVVVGHSQLVALLGQKAISDIKAGLEALRSPTDISDRKLTDLGNAERFRNLHGENVRYVPKDKCWQVWNGQRWVQDDNATASQLAQDTTRQMLREAGNLVDSRARDELVQHALRSQSRRRIDDMLALARTLKGITADPREFDTHPLLINLANGTLDLATGKLMHHNREHMLTRLAPVSWDPEAQAPRWRAHIHRVMGGNSEMVDYLQEALGMALTGDMRERVWFILYGSGKNGKSVTTDTVAGVLGDYARHLPASTLASRRPDAATNDLLDLRGIRFATGDETDEGIRLAEALVKQLTGSAAISARRLYGEFQTFTPTATVFLSTNHKPEIHGGDQGIWDRTRLIGFTVRILPDEVVPNFTQILLAEEREGILVWLVEGCRRWLQRGRLETPKRVLVDTERYQTEMDIVGQFLSDECITHDERGSGAEQSEDLKGLYLRYQEWCKQSGVPSRKKSRFKQDIMDRGHLVERSTKHQNRVRVFGVELPDTPFDQAVEGAV